MNREWFEMCSLKVWQTRKVVLAGCGMVVVVAWIWMSLALGSFVRAAWGGRHSKEVEVFGQSHCQKQSPGGIVCKCWCQKVPGNVTFSFDESVLEWRGWYWGCIQRVWPQNQC